MTKMLQFNILFKNIVNSLLNAFKLIKYYLNNLMHYLNNLLITIFKSFVKYLINSIIGNLKNREMHL
jgi:hypothetical protein